jgi:tRNA uridine 5-carbamoylmethylation protein Kti12
MLVKIFLTGLPGSGKSTAYRSIYQYLEGLSRGWQVLHINDYEILKARCVFNLKHTWGILVKTWEVENTGDCQALKDQIKRLVDTELIPEPVPA